MGFRQLILVPGAPRSLVLEIDREWNGAACRDARLHGRVELAARAAGLALRAWVSDPAPERIPDAPAGSRVADLWRYDVAECFLVGGGGRYLEVELGAGGHFLVLSFDAPRRCCDAYETLRPRVSHRRDVQGWQAEILLPWRLVPAELQALNAFVIARGHHLAYHPLPGAAPDFHQPAAFPHARLEDEERAR